VVLAGTVYALSILIKRWISRTRKPEIIKFK